MKQLITKLGKQRFMSNKTILAQTMLNGLYYSNAYRLIENKFQGIGVIFTLHHVVKTSESSRFDINRILEITPEFLDKTIHYILSLDYDIISLDQVQQRIINRNFNRRFVCFTLDDGYIDNYQNAFPVFKKYNVPFAVYVATGIIEGKAILWWRCLEQIILQENRIELVIHNQEMRFVIESLQQKQHVFNMLYWRLRNMPLDQQHDIILNLMKKHNLSYEKLCLDCAMSWDMLQEMANHSLVTIGTHTVSHLALAKLSTEEVKREAGLCRDILRQKLQVGADHFCYPYGDIASANIREFNLIKELGFKTATTTRKAVISNNTQNLHALSRIPLNGHYQHQRFVRLLLSGVPTGLWQKTKGYG